MVSLLKKVNWLRPLTPKYAEESLSSEDENSTESLQSFTFSMNTEGASQVRMSNENLPYLVTQEDPQLISTSSISIMKSSGNLRSSISNYKAKSASRIQLFYRLKKLHLKFKTLIKVVRQSMNTFRKRRVLNKLLLNIKSQNLAAVCIQKNWKFYLEKKDNDCGLSPRRRLLSRTVTIGSKLIKIQKVIETVVLNRNFSSPSSPDNIPLVRLKGKLVHQRSLSSGISLFRSLSDSQDTNSCTFRFGQGEFSTDSCKSFSNASLLIKRPIRIRTKRIHPLNIDQLSNQLDQDIFLHKPFQNSKTDSLIPQLLINSKFFEQLEQESSKKSLECEYKELVKP